MRTRVQYVVVWGCAFAAFDLLGCRSPSADRAVLQPPPSDAPAQDIPAAEPPGRDTFTLALPAGQSAWLCCDSGDDRSGTGCRRVGDEEAANTCLQRGAWSFACTGAWTTCASGTCTCGEPVGAGRLLCCVSVEGNRASDCAPWGEPDFTGCKDAGRTPTVCADAACKKSGSGSGQDCTCS